MAKSIKMVRNHLTHHFTSTAPYGNDTSRTHWLTTNEAGIVESSLDKKAIEAGDKVVLASLPEGFCMADATLYVMKPLTGNASLGFEYVDGEDDKDVPQNDKYFFADKDVGTKSRIRADGSDLVVLPKDAYLILTCASAHTKESIVRVEVRGELMGNA